MDCFLPDGLPFNTVANARLNSNSSGTEKVALTYANDMKTDGAGAQLQRIYGIYALSRYLNLPYIHSPLKHLSNHGLVALENKNFIENLESRYNEVFALPSDVECPSDVRVHYLENPSLEEIEAIRKLSMNSDEFHLIRILFPYAINDRNPEIYRCLHSVSPFKRGSAGVFKIGIHVRRGDLMVAETETARMLPNSYYVATALNLIAYLKKKKIAYQCEIYTEVPTKAFVVRPGDPLMDRQTTHEVVVDPESHFLKDFEVIPNLVEIVNIDPIESMERMATADTLIMSRSSFSYLAAVLNTTGIVIYYPFWHGPLKGWLVSDSKGVLPEKELKEQLKPWGKVGWLRSWLRGI